MNDLPALPFLVDTGAGGNGVCDEAFQKWGGVLDGGEAAVSATAGGHSDVRIGLEGTLSVGSEPTQPTKLFVQTCASSSDGGPPQTDSLSIEKFGYVGAPWFWKRIVYFPTDRRRMVFTEPATSSDESGLHSKPAKNANE